jgi:hypothetical protein
MLVRWLTSGPVPGIAVPRRWVGLADGRMALGRVADARRASAGILAHHYFGHSDGAWLVLYAWLRLEARRTAVRRVRGSRPSRGGRARLRRPPRSDLHADGVTTRGDRTWEATSPPSQRGFRRPVLTDWFAILGWAFWKVNERKDAAPPRALRARRRVEQRADRGDHEGRGGTPGAQGRHRGATPRSRGIGELFATGRFLRNDLATCANGSLYVPHEDERTRGRDHRRHDHLPRGRDPRPEGPAGFASSA